MSSASSSAAAAAAETSAPVAAASAAPFHTSLLPSGRTLHTLYLRGISAEQFKTIKQKQSSVDCALIKADMIADLFQLECAAVKASLQALRGKLKTKNIHTEFAFHLGYTGHFQTSLDFITAKASSAAGAQHALLICILHADQEKLNSLVSLLNDSHLTPHVTPLSQLPIHVDSATLTKHYKISESELSFVPQPSSTAVSSASEQLPPLSPLALALINRISVKV